MSKLPLPYKLTRIERHRQMVSWLATFPLLVGLFGIMSYFFKLGIPCWLNFTLIALGFGLGIVFLSLGHKRLAIAPILYSWNEDGTLCVMVGLNSFWDRALDKPYQWQRVMYLFPGVYLLQGEPFLAPAGKLRRVTDVFHSNPDEIDEEKDNK